ncbi:MAG: hypothetical protein EOO88_58080 [Pedobacter sp.]|nr:MAG: hypothetical protein EOO88_58080 [Pedobacter sp.]
MYYLNAKGLGAWHTSPRSFFSLTMGVSLKVPFRQPYYNSRILGYGDQFLQGYEYYVMDGVAGGYMKATFGRKILDFKLRIPGFKKLAPRDIPFKIYGKVFGRATWEYENA